MTIKYQQEFLESCLDEAKVLLEKHWKEIALNKDKIKLNPDWEAYAELEAVGKLKIFTARDFTNTQPKDLSQGTLVGYFVVFVDRHIHYKDHIFAVNDLLFLSEEYRKGLTGVKLIKFAEGCLKSDGVSVMIVNTSTKKPFDVLMNRLGFNLIERVYSKYLGD
jgi:GNAT superfamily N-acetyltransferase